MNEFELINFIKEYFKSDYIGDDAFCYKNCLISKDILIENVHFILNDNFFEIGAKSLISNISDIIAMGGEVKFFFLGLGLPDKLSFNNLEKFLEGVKFIANKYKLILGGGDISKSLNDFFISITIVGNVINKPVKRNNAKLGDNIYVAGEVGDSEIGLRIIKGEFSCKNKNYFIKKHYIKELYPEFIKTLVNKEYINSMIDISDGFLQDLNHILDDSNKSAEIYVKNIPVSLEYQKLETILKEDFYRIPLISGEEYSLIFTSNKKYDNKIKSIANDMNVKVTKVGEVIKRQKKKVIFKDLNIKLYKEGYIHF